MKSRDLQDDQTTRDLTALIARLPDESPPADFTQSVMQQIAPKTAGFRGRLWRRLLTPWVVIPIRPLPATAALVLLAGLVIATRSFWMPLHERRPIAEMVHTQTKSVNFILDWPAAEKVAVMGSFNRWQPEQYPMHRNPSDGTWQLTIKLQPGRHAYAFVIDGSQVISDPHALWGQDDGFGARNSILTIENGNSDEDRI